MVSAIGAAAIGLIVVPILVEQLNRPPHPMDRGKKLYLAMFEWEFADEHGGWPRYGTNSSEFEFADSTDYFRRLAENESKNIEDFSFFSLRGLKSANTTDPVGFTSANNAWCIAANVDVETPDGTPLLFTRNINITNTSGFVGPVAETLTDEEPYGREGAFVVMQGGAVVAVRPGDRWERILGMPPPSNKPVLRP